MDKPDFIAVPRNATVTDLVAVSGRARSYLAARNATGFSRRGLKDVVARGFSLMSDDDYRRAFWPCGCEIGATDHGVGWSDCPHLSR